MATATKTVKTPTTIKQAAFNRFTVKATNEVFYTVRSDSDASTWYTLRWSFNTQGWDCSCASIKPCKHIRCLNEHLAARAEVQKAAAQAILARGEQLLSKGGQLLEETPSKCTTELEAEWQARYGNEVMCVACGVLVAKQKAQHLAGQSYCRPCCEAEIMRRRETATLKGSNRGFSLFK